MRRSDVGSCSLRASWTAVAALLWATTACAAPPSAEPESQAGGDLVTCTEPRPQVCTMQYDPVCGRIGEGDGAEWKTYASDCSACGDPEVSAYRQDGECK